jgi:hypothetical protein
MPNGDNEVSGRKRALQGNDLSNLTEIYPRAHLLMRRLEPRHPRAHAASATRSLAWGR